jgi:hypothetical protein
LHGLFSTPWKCSSLMSFPCLDDDLHGNIPLNVKPVKSVLLEEMWNWSRKYANVRTQETTTIKQICDDRLLIDQGRWADVGDERMEDVWLVRKEDLRSRLNDRRFTKLKTRGNSRI